jgi:hypothetical protein
MAGPYPLSPLQLAREFREGLSEITPLSDEELETLCGGRPIQDAEKMQKILDEVAKDYEEEYAGSVKWLSSISFDLP